MLRLGGVGRDDRGASAIEYSLIAGIVALGLIGSLVATRGSIRMIFGVASNQMGSANAGGSSGPVTAQRAIAAATSSGRYAYWSAKTLTAKTVTNPTPTSQLTTFTYADGTSGSYLVNYDSTGRLTSEIVTTYPWQGAAGRTMDSNVASFDANGTIQSMLYTNRNSDGTTSFTASVSSANWHSEQVTYYNASGGVSNQINGYDDPNVPASMQKSTDVEIYFRALANS